MPRDNDSKLTSPERPVVVEPARTDVPKVEAVQSPPEPRVDDGKRDDEPKEARRRVPGHLARLDERARNEMLRLEKLQQEHDHETAKATAERREAADKERRAVDSGKAEHFETVTYTDK